MRRDDFAIRAQVRRLLARRWIGDEGLELGVTEGVVLMRGELRRGPLGPLRAVRDDEWEGLRSELIAEVRRIPGVIDVVTELRCPQPTERACPRTNQ